MITKFRKGDKFKPPTEDWNTIADFINRQGGGPPGGGDFGGGQISGDFVWVKNGTSSTLSKYKVLGLGAPVFTPTASAGELIRFQTKPQFVGATPVVATHWNKPAVTLETIRPNEIGLCLLSGVVPVQVDIQHASHTWADVTTTTANLKSYATGGAKILSTISSTGVQWCLVQLGQVFKGPLRGLTDASISKGSSGTVSIYTNAGSDTGYNVDSVENLFAAVGSGKKVHVVEIDTGTSSHPVYNLSAAEC